MVREEARVPRSAVIFALNYFLPLVVFELLLDSRCLSELLGANGGRNFAPVIPAFVGELLGFWRAVFICDAERLKIQENLLVLLR